MIEVREISWLPFGIAKGWVLVDDQVARRLSGAWLLLAPLAGVAVAYFAPLGDVRLTVLVACGFAFTSGFAWCAAIYSQSIKSVQARPDRPARYFSEARPLVVTSWLLLLIGVIALARGMWLHALT
ncbi:MAG: hypothetical protein ABUS57_07685 [Pseudomonadota bacterium]